MIIRKKTRCRVILIDNSWWGEKQIVQEGLRIEFDREWKWIYWFYWWLEEYCDLLDSWFVWVIDEQKNSKYSSNMHKGMRIEDTNRDGKISCFLS